MTVRVGFDPEIFVRQQRGGISRYFSELVSAFSTHPELGISPVLMARRTSHRHLEPVNAEPMPAKPLRPTAPGLQRLLNGPDWSKDLYIDYRAGAYTGEPVDILHATYFRPRRRDLNSAHAVVTTVYDLIPECLGTAGQSAHRGRRLAFERADLILSISHATATLFATYYPHLTGKLSVVPLAVDGSIFTASPRERSRSGFPYLLYVGTRAGYKNFWMLPAALQAARAATGHDVGLIMVGPSSTPPEDARLAEHLPRDRFVFLSVEDRQLADLYRSAEALVLTSTMEGFGLPLLEGLACGTPTIASDIPAFREVGQEACRYFSADSISQLTQQISDLLASPGDRDLTRAAGILRASAFTWLKTAQLTSEAYISVTDGRRR